MVYLCKNKLDNQGKKKKRKDGDTWTSIRSVSRTLSLLIRSPSFVGEELGVSDNGGVGGGKGWSIGVPYGRCRFRGGWRTGAVGTDEEIGGIINADEEEGGAKKEEGFRRFVTRLLLPIGSRVSWRGVGLDEAERESDGTCGVGAGEETTLDEWEDKGRGAEEW